MIIISDIMWNEIKLVIPQKTTKVGRPQNDPRITLSGILFVLITGIQWRYLPEEYGKPSSVHGTFRRWIKAGTFDNILKVSVSNSLKHFGSLEWLFTDTSSSKAPLAQFAGKNPTDRSKNGVKKSVVIDSNKIILSLNVDRANKHDSKFLLSHLNEIENYLPSKPIVMTGDSAYDDKKLYKQAKSYNIALVASINIRRNKNKIKFKPKGRWRVEQIFGIQNWNRGIKFCWTKTKDSFLALCKFAAAVHNFKLIGIFV